MKIINPHSGQFIIEVAEDDEQSLFKKYTTLIKGQADWQSVGLSHRKAIISRYLELLEETLEVGAQLLTQEVGKPLQQSRNEINGARARISWMLDHVDKALAEEVMTANSAITELIRYEPLGVVANISAWNYPYLVGTNVIIPALLAGNAVLYKPSEFAILTGMHMDELLKRAGVPENVFQLAIGAGDVGNRLIDLPLNGYFFTGSYATGHAIYKRVAEKMVPCQCELGGKDPLYVADDVEDIKAVAVATADGAFYNNGQSCCAVKRIYVHERVYDAYIKEFIEEVKSWKVGDPLEEGVYIGALTRPAQIDLLNRQVTDAVSKGAIVMTGGKAIAGPGNHFEPTVIAGVTHEMELMKEESFGPIIGIMKVSDDEEAIRLMNDTPYGLTASVYSSSQLRAEKILHKMNTGTGYWNCCDRVSAALPWSGRGHSGFGSTLSHVGLRAFTQPKAYHLKK